MPDVRRLYSGKARRHRQGRHRLKQKGKGRQGHVEERRGIALLPDSLTLVMSETFNGQIVSTASSLHTSLDLSLGTRWRPTSPFRQSAESSFVSRSFVCGNFNSLLAKIMETIHEDETMERIPGEETKTGEPELIVSDGEPIVSVRGLDSTGKARAPCLEHLMNQVSCQTLSSFGKILGSSNVSTKELELLPLSPGRAVSLRFGHSW
jgi:hypothetical protein